MICSICGMNVNSNNYSYNKEAFLSENTKEFIKYCPFCGVHEIYLCGKLLNAAAEDLDIRTKDILDHGVKLEIFNGDFYKAARDLCNNKENKALFNSLSNIEYTHAKIHMRLLSLKRIPEINKLDYSRYSEIELISLANKREIHAVEFYRRYIDDVNNEIVKKVFKALQEVEKDHIKLTCK